MPTFAPSGETIASQSRHPAFIHQKSRHRDVGKTRCPKEDEHLAQEIWFLYPLYWGSFFTVLHVFGFSERMGWPSPWDALGNDFGGPSVGPSGAGYGDGYSPTLWKNLLEQKPHTQTLHVWNICLH